MNSHDTFTRLAKQGYEPIVCSFVRGFGSLWIKQANTQTEEKEG